MNIVFSVDFEDWYQGMEFPMSEWPKYGPRIEKGLLPLLDLLDRHGVKATFFTLGWVARQYPLLVKDVAARGHEIGSHGYSHEKVYNLGPDLFREEIRQTKNIIEDLTGQPVVVHRSPIFSITPRSLWALPILAEEGYKIDCSINPVKTWRYGIANCPDEIFRIREAGGLIEFPVSTFHVLHKRWAIGGAYFRILPYFFTKKGIRHRLEEHRSTMFYIHPWEYDPGHPVVPFEWKAKLTHYARLRKTYPYTGRMLGDFSFTTLSNYVSDYANRHPLRELSLNVLHD
jgi:polysaccharide deacetylase family protein (PEP-CTERM system associated)